MLGDLAFLLIIFFLLLSGMNATGSLEMVHGEKGVGERGTSLMPDMDEKGRLSRMDRQIGARELATLLSEAHEVTLIVDFDTAWEDVVGFLGKLGDHAIPVILEVPR